MEGVKLDLYEGLNDLFLYDFIVKDDFLGQLEVQFDDGEFNGVIVYAGFNTENEVGEFEWVEVPKGELYNFVRDRAIKDYNK